LHSEKASRAGDKDKLFAVHVLTYYRSKPRPLIPSKHIQRVSDGAFVMHGRASYGRERSRQTP
jgi:hypothetical protein